VEGLLKHQGVAEFVPIIMASDNVYKERIAEWEASPRVLRIPAMRSTAGSKAAASHSSTETDCGSFKTDQEAAKDRLASGCFSTPSYKLNDALKKMPENALAWQKRGVTMDSLLQGQVGLLVDMWVVAQAGLFLPTLYSTIGETVCNWRAAFIPGGGRMLPPVPCRYLSPGVALFTESVVEERSETLNLDCRVGFKPCSAGGVSGTPKS
jgi:hypothetical protein